MNGYHRPDIVVGIDIGQTCSGVAYSIGPDWSDPRIINRWPGHYGIEQADKVATRVGYKKNDSKPTNWGFQSIFGDDSLDVREQFKLTLDPEYEDDRGFSCDHARTWYFHYLNFLHFEIEKFFETCVPNWQNMHIEYNFSTPTTWSNPAMIDSIERLIKSAGFTLTPQQSVRMALTEAEAAAIEASTTNYQTGDIFLICDAGGGTTDVNVLKVKSTQQKIELEPLDHVEGVPIGSTLIDFQMTQHILSRLRLIEGHLDRDPLYLAEEMLMGQFQTIKHSFPDPDVDEFRLDVRGLAGSQSFPEAGIVNSRMIINRKTLLDIFDHQLQQIFDLIDERLEDLRKQFPSEKVSYIILSGGLGSSPYLYQKAKEHYDTSAVRGGPIQIKRVPEPQLAVVRGLVKERTQELGIENKPGQEVFKTRRCRNNYGLVVRSAYDENLHKGLPVLTDPLNKRQWVDEFVDWFITEGQQIDVHKGIQKPYGATMAEADVNLPRRARIVMSSHRNGSLPRTTTDSGCQEVVSVVYKLKPCDMKLKNRQFWKLKKKYWKADFSFVVKPGPADLKFQILGANGLLSSDHDNLQVEYMEPYEVHGEQRSASQSHW